MNIKKKDYRPVFIMLIVIAILVITNIVLSTRFNGKPIDYSALTEQEIEDVVEQEINTLEMYQLKDMEERDRMEFYTNKFLEKVQNREYDKAYEMLNEEFRNSYFPTVEAFEDYCIKKLPLDISIRYDNIERNGEIYILWTSLYSTLSGTSNTIDYNFVIKENALNDVEMSFSVKQ